MGRGGNKILSRRKKKGVLAGVGDPGNPLIRFEAGSTPRIQL